MTEHVADQHHHDPAAAHDAHSDHNPDAHADHHGGHHNDPESIRKEVRRYMIVLGALAVLTIVTVAVSKLELPTWQAVALALAIATVKGTLVAAFFMHLLSERKLIYAVLGLTVFFFGVMMWGPWHHRDNAEKVWPGYDVNASRPDSPAPTDKPPSGH
ncbi:MAG TPA: cytochrome C oxidase subunit IV family protein [Thermoanaerobaculia bacterium]|jgi:cytochrome c oxidase subunit 4